MKKHLLLLLLFLAATLNAQNTFSDCSQGQSLCGALGEPFLNTVDAGNAAPGPDFGCLQSQPNPFWFYLPISQAGMLHYTISQESLTGNPLDVDFIIYGPFADQESACSQLTEANIVGCSYSAAAVESFTIYNAQPGDFYVLMVTNYSDQPGYITITDNDDSTGAIDCSGINLNAFLDSNANGVQDDGETGFPAGSFNYEANNDGNVHSAFTTDGTYTIYDTNLDNTYTINFSILPEYAANYLVTNPSYSNINVSPGSEIATYNFPVTVTTPFNDLAVYITPSDGSPVPGQSYYSTIIYTNLGTQPVSGTINYTANNGMTINNTSDTVTADTDHSFTYDFTGLQPFEIRILTVVLHVPETAVSGDLVSDSAQILPDDNDVSINNNTYTSTEEVIGSYDPNDITESRGRDIPASTFTDDDYLYYTIRFQNTGNANALNISIDNTLNSQLDPSTLEMISSSHNYILHKEGNELTWTFHDIQLPPSETDEEASHGYIYYRVKPFTHNAGDIIPNSADIYFDYNAVVTTNTFETHFTTEAAVPVFAKNSFMVHPNPAKNTVNITMNAGQSIKLIKIFDVTGKLVYSNSNLNGNSATLDISALRAGAYFIEITNNYNTRDVKKLLVQ